EAAHIDANIIFGTVIDDSLGDEVRVTVIAAGFDGGAPVKRPLEVQSAIGRGNIGAGRAGEVGQSERPAAAAPAAPAEPAPAPPVAPREPVGTPTGSSLPPLGSTGSRAVPVGNEDGEDDDVDVPSFMRR
ncbi:cell division protein FtsZ, partial [Rhodococcus hoagii]|nr:cell division protein FtsZ [Prescottella equi]